MPKATLNLTLLSNVVKAHCVSALLLTASFAEIAAASGHDKQPVVQTLLQKSEQPISLVAHNAPDAFYEALDKWNSDVDAMHPLTYGEVFGMPMLWCSF